MNSSTESNTVATNVSSEPSHGSFLPTLMPSNLIKSTIGTPQVVAWVMTLTYYTWFLFITIGVCCNILSFAIFVRRVKKQAGAANIYFTTLAVFDAVYLFWFALFGILLFQSNPTNFQWLSGCNFMAVMIFLVAQMSTLLVTTLAIDRCVAIKHPFLYRRIQSKKQAVAIITGLAVFVAIMGWQSFGGLQPIEEEELASEYWAFHCRGKEDFIDSYNFVWYPWIDIIIFWAVPSVIILVCNVVIIKTIRSAVPREMRPERAANDKHTPDTEENETSTNSNFKVRTSVAFQKHGKQLTRTSLVMSFSFLVLVAPALFFRLVQLIVEMRGKALPLSEEDFIILEQIMYVFYLTNYGCNFWLYCF